MLQQEAMIERTRSVCREDERLAAAYLSAWEWGRALVASLGNRHGVALPASLAWRLDRRFAEPSALLAWRDRET
jgi:hypothetical protein